ncbi:Myc-type, basic helix-loop-helix (bHLH) domain-containing protein [Aphelenchoides fujianensis]|nr:Myc-type, basic helix-loop-helix (bHLH) domain-containing protein [Aphelenchoides fujianensis]
MQSAMTTNGKADHRSRAAKHQQATAGGGQVRKSSKEQRERAKTLEKLRRMVGSDENCSQLEVMQHVIDYIVHLRAKLQEDVPHESKEEATFLREIGIKMANVFKH